MRYTCMASSDTGNQQRTLIDLPEQRPVVHDIPDAVADQRQDVGPFGEPLQVFGTQAGVFADPGQHLRSDLFVVVKRKDDIGPLRAGGVR